MSLISTCIKPPLRKVIAVPIVWGLIRRFVSLVFRVYHKLSTMRRQRPAEPTRQRPVRPVPDGGLDTLCEEFFADLTVRHGPFKGMKYPSFRAICSSIYPKLLGSYEMELHAIVSRINEHQYDTIVDIGCAEGYYAVGFGMRHPHATIHVFDTDNEALDLCELMASLNGVKVARGGFCSKNTLMNLDLGARALIVSDCEGYEGDLFDLELVRFLAPHDVVIEVHDFNDIKLTETLMNLFSQTHNCEVIRSIDDIIKAYDYHFDELTTLDIKQRFAILDEGRPCAMQWIFAESRAGTQCRTT